tara:strand:- start:497 stop:2017 length:1521 start_codon:yes stop_codon:yes gene_type:complete
MAEEVKINPEAPQDNAYYSATEDFIEGKINTDTIAGAGGLLALAGAGRAMYKALPKGGIPKLYADFSENFLEGFYDRGATKNDQLKLYAKQFKEATKRIGALSINPAEMYTYKKTGVSTLLKDQLKGLDNELIKVQEDYLAGKYGEGIDKKTGKVIQSHLDKAKKAQSKIIKQVHYKILNDAANSEIFTAGKKPMLMKYVNREGRISAKPWWEKTNAKTFAKEMPNKDIAKYVIDRQPELLKKGGLGTKGFRYLRWNDNSISGVLRGAQFNSSTYYMLDTLRNEANASRILGKPFDINSGLSMIADSRGGANPRNIGGKIVFEFSPKIKSNFDWGGYNAVGIWDPKKPDKITFTATDLRDTPASRLLPKGTKNVVNYVPPKEFSIAELKEEVEVEEPKKTGRTNKPGAGRPKGTLSPRGQAGRLKQVQQGLLNPGGMYKGIIEDSKTLLDDRQSLKTKVTNNAWKKLFQAKSGYGKYLRHFGKTRYGAPAAVLLGLGYAMFGDNEE